MANPVVITVTPAAADDDGISLSQTPGAAGNLTITGALASGDVATIGSNAVNASIERQVLLTFAASEVGHNFTIYGTNVGGQVISETIAGTGIGTVVSTLAYYTVTRVAISAAATGAIKVGTNGVAYTPWQAVNYHITPVNLSFAVVVAGTINYTLEYTYDDINVITSARNVFSISALAAKATTLDSSLAVPIVGWRLKINSFTAPTGSAVVTGIQAGLRN